MERSGQLDAILGGARDIYVSGYAAEIADLPAILQRSPPGARTVTGLFSPSLNRTSYADPGTGTRMRTFFLNRETRQHLKQGMVEYCPWRYRMIDRWLAAPGRFDTALVMLSPPDARGRCSLGVQVDFLPSFHRQVARIVGFINPAMPRAAGDGYVDFSALAAKVDYDVPVKSAAPAETDPVATTIARSIANLVQDGATVQFGLGQIPSRAVGFLHDHRGLRVHSGVVDDRILGLEQSDALDRDGLIVTGTAVGTSALYDALNDHQRFSLRSVAYTHDPGIIGTLPRFTAINSALQADLLGQVSAEASGGRLVSSPGGLPEFVRAALGSKDGRSIVALRAGRVGTRSSGIVPMLDRPHAVTLTAADADILVTEFGVAHLRDLSVDQRVDAIIAVADPQDQTCLVERWAKMRADFVA